MKVLDLFSGIGGFSKGLEAAGMETIAFCEYDKHAQAVLKKNWPGVPITKDVRDLDGKQFRGTADVVCGGFPCQDVSTAGKQAGIDGGRTNLYTEMLRVISECRSRYAIFENVTGLLSGNDGKWFGQFLYDLAQIGYSAEWHCISAGYIGAPHHRDRVWVIAYPNVQRCEGKPKVSHAIQQQIQSLRVSQRERDRFSLSESPLPGADDGVPGRSHRIKQLGNAVVPFIPMAIGRAIIEVEKMEAAR